MSAEMICIINWASFVLLQIRAKFVTNWGSFIITNQGKCCYRLGQLLQIRVTAVRKQSSYYKLGQNVLQIGAGITNQGNYYKLGHNIHRSRATVRSCLRGSEIFSRRYFVGPSFFLGVFRGSQIFPRGYFVGPKLFLVGISWLSNFFPWIFCESNIFSRGYFEGPKFFMIFNMLQ